VNKERWGKGTGQEQEQWGGLFMVSLNFHCLRFMPQDTSLPWHMKDESNTAGTQGACVSIRWSYE